MHKIFIGKPITPILKNYIRNIFLKFLKFQPTYVKFIRIHGSKSVSNCGAFNRVAIKT